MFNDRGVKVLLRPDGYTRYRAGRDIHHLPTEIDLGPMPLPRLRSKLEPSGSRIRTVRGERARAAS